MTPQQSKVFEFLKTYAVERNGVMPTFDEIAAHIGIRSKSGVSRIVEELIDQRKIRRRAYKARGLEFVGVERDDVLVERERCAKIAEQQANSLTNGGAVNACRAIARAIRGTA